MKRLSVLRLEEGMVVARTVYDGDARVLLHAGIILDKIYIKRLQELGINSIYVKDPLINDIVIPEPISETTRIQTIKVIKDNFTNLESNRKLNIKAVKTLVENILDELLQNYNLLIHLTDIRTYDDYTFAHSVNVCILSIMTGITLGYHDLKLRELGLGALLHDVGKVRIDKEILNKPDDLTRKEYDEIKKHPAYGFEILRQYQDIPLLSAHVAYQHHERWDGNGYPRKLKGSEIHEYARIVAAADIYDALLADRPYRPAYSINQALIVLKRLAGTYLDKEVVTALISNIAIYPIGTIVELNTGDVAVVVDVNKEYPNRPVLKVIYHKRTHRLATPHEIDLSKLTTVVIKTPLTIEEFTKITNMQK
ncbi:MAG TPA: HD-GYP domain-containing protein [Syntrophomonadaceae bacterium]|nr:HD-GYP domain-containing protein [Syntrophomonadaceae bacterium]